MRREQFLRELEALLGDIPELERQEALQYYQDYFDDAGPENEAKVMEELGSPAKVAQTIKMDLGESDGAFTEQGYQDQRVKNGEKLSPETYESGKKDTKQTNGWKLAFLVLISLLLLPVVLPLGLALLLILAVIVIAVISVVIGVGAVALALVIAGIAVVVVGIGKALLMPATGAALAGAGLLLLGVGILAVVVIAWCFVKFLPWLIRGIVKLLRAPFRK